MSLYTKQSEQAARLRGQRKGREIQAMKARARQRLTRAVACRLCKALPGAPCRTLDGASELRDEHSARKTAAAEARKAGLIK